MLVSNMLKSAVSARFRHTVLFCFAHFLTLCFCFSDCGNVIAHGGASVAASDCSTPCTGNPSETCGAGNRLNMYWSGATPPPPPEIVPKVGPWVSLGCYTYVQLLHFLNERRPVTHLLLSQTAMAIPGL